MKNPRNNLFGKMSIYDKYAQTPETPRFARDQDPPVVVKLFYLRGCPNLAPVVNNFFKVGKTTHTRCVSLPSKP